MKFRASTRRLRHGHPLLQGPPRPPAPTSAACGAGPGPGSARSLHRRDGERLAAGHLRHADRRTANTTYVASYYAPSRYVGQLRPTSPPRPPRAATDALQNGTDGGNGVYRYGTPSAFPTSTLQQRELLGGRRLRGRPGHDAADRHARTPAPGATGCPRGADVTATFSEPVQQPRSRLELATGRYAGRRRHDLRRRDPHRDPRPDGATLSRHDDLHRDRHRRARHRRQPDRPGLVDVHHRPRRTRPSPTVSARSPAPGASGVSTAINTSATFSEAVQASTITFELRTPGGALGRGRPRPTTRATPHGDARRRPATLAASTTYTATVSGARDTAGNQMDPVTLDVHDGGARRRAARARSGRPPPRRRARTRRHERGRARREVPDRPQRVRHRDPVLQGPSQNTGTHVGSLWTRPAPGSAQVTFTGGTASGWQQATFSRRRRVGEHDVRGVVLHADGGYVVNSGYFSSAATNGPADGAAERHRRRQRRLPLHLHAEHVPQPSFGSENYWVDVVFQEDSTDTTPPTVISRVPTPTRPASRWESGRRRPSASRSPGRRSRWCSAAPAARWSRRRRRYDTGTRTATLTPSIDLGHSTSYSVEVSGARDGANNTMSPVSWSFQTSAPPPPGIEDGPGGPIAVVTSSRQPVVVLPRRRSFALRGSTSSPTCGSPR